MPAFHPLQEEAARHYQQHTSYCSVFRLLAESDQLIQLNNRLGNTPGGRADKAQSSLNIMLGAVVP